MIKFLPNKKTEDIECVDTCGQAEKVSGLHRRKHPGICAIDRGERNGGGKSIEW